MAAPDSHFDPRTLALLNRIANNRRSSLQSELPAQLAARGALTPTSGARSKLHALLGTADGGLRRASAAEAHSAGGGARCRATGCRAPELWCGEGVRDWRQQWCGEAWRERA